MKVHVEMDIEFSDDDTVFDIQEMFVDFINAETRGILYLEGIKVTEIKEN